MRLTETKPQLAIDSRNVIVLHTDLSVGYRMNSSFVFARFGVLLRLGLAALLIGLIWFTTLMVTG